MSPRDRGRAGTAFGAGWVVLAITSVAMTFSPSLAVADDVALVVEQAPTTTTTTTSTTVPPTTAPPTTAVQPQRPISPPRQAYYSEPVVQIGRLQIPRLGLDTVLYQGLSLSTIDHGPSHWPGTAMPGHLGNTVVAGHRVTNTRPFRHLDTLHPGDLATFVTAAGTFVYEFVNHEIVTPDRVDIASQAGGYRATMFACHPPGSARERIVAYWRMVSAPAPGQPVLTGMPSS